MNYSGPAESVKFPSLCIQDGPLGLRYADNISAFPAGITAGATWNRDLIRERGVALGLEARAKGVNVILGPSMGPMGMMPAGGRNWEGFGSDPVLQGVAAAETIRGIQSTGVMATAKHFIMNEQEHFRQSSEWLKSSAITVDINDRALHEVFVWPFAESVRADVASVMCAYQQVNGSYACENSKILNGVLKDELGFQGFVQSDWLAQRSGVNSALSGLDMSMPGDGLNWADGKSLWGSELTRAVLNSTVPIERLNDMVTRIVAAWYHLKQDTWEAQGPNFSSWTNQTMGGLHPGSKDDKTNEAVNRFVDAQGQGADAHSLIARKVAAEGTILLKNYNKTLPLSREATEPGKTYRVGIYGEDAGLSSGGPNECPDRGCNRGTLASGWGSGAVDFPYLVSPWEALRTAWNAETVEIRGYLTNETPRRERVEDRDLCIVFGNADGGEGFINYDAIHGDRNDLHLQKGANRLIVSVASHCGKGKGKTVVVLHSVGPVIVEPWIDHPGIYAIVLANLPGQESGGALEDVLFGEVDASGRLPFTIGRSVVDYGASAQILYSTDSPDPLINLMEGLYIDYRFFDRYNIPARFEFGYGLSYTTFDLGNSSVTALQGKPVGSLSEPKERVDDNLIPPSYDTSLPDAKELVFPPEFRPLHKYIYPYLNSTDDAEAKDPYPFPVGYKDGRSVKRSPAGGGAGGNPSLYEEVVKVQTQVHNTGDRKGKEVVQVYVTYPEDVKERAWSLSWHTEGIDFPVRVLRNFTKVELEPKQQRTVEMTLSRKDLSYWSSRHQNWIMPGGEMGIWVGKSSRNLKEVGRY